MYDHPENSNLTGKSYQDYAHMVACVIKSVPAVAWSFKIDGDNLGSELAVSNCSAKKSKLELEIAGDFQKNEKVDKKITLPVGGQEKIEQKLSPGYSAKGTIYGKVNDGSSGEQLFFFAQKLGLAHVSGAGRSEKASGKDYTMEYYPSSKMANIRFQETGKDFTKKLLSGFARADIFVYRDTREVLRIPVKEIIQAENNFNLTFSLPCEDDGIYNVKAVLVNTNGECIKTVFDEIAIKKQSWMGNNIGNERTVIPPFIPMEVKKNSVNCLGRKYILAGSGLPEQIISQGYKELAAPVILRMKKNSRESELKTNGKLTFTEVLPDMVKFKSIIESENLKININGTAEYDGVIFYELELENNDAVPVEELFLEIPFKDLKYLHTSTDRRSPMIYAMQYPGKNEFIQPDVPVWRKGYDYSGNSLHALYFPENDGLIWSSAGIKSRNILGDFLPFILIGNPQYGLFWFADSDRGWNNDPGKPSFELQRTNDAAVLKINFISAKTSLDSPVKITFAITATPVRPKIKGGNIAFKTGCEGFNVIYGRGGAGHNIPCGHV